MAVTERPPHAHSIKRFGPVADYAGYWGPVTASVDWCETNYAVSHYVAEFFNSTSNAITIGVGIMLFRRARVLGLERRFQLAPLFLSLVGLGSLCFHGTLLYEAQLLDELPMIFMAQIMCYIAIEKWPQNRYPWLPVTMWIAGFAYAFAHVYFRLVVTFHILFGALMAPILVLPLTFTKSDPILKRAFVVGFATLMASFTAWELDQIFCHHIEQLYLHCFWHIGTSIAGIQWLEAMMYIRLKHIHHVPGVRLHTRIFGIFPVIHFSAKSARHIGSAGCVTLSAATAAAVAACAAAAATIDIAEPLAESQLPTTTHGTSSGGGGRRPSALDLSTMRPQLQQQHHQPLSALASQPARPLSAAGPKLFSPVWVSFSEALSQAISRPQTPITAPPTPIDGERPSLRLRERRADRSGM
ncbi:ceramidase-domain-containing protein [Blastocladiella britannica]|nr:ceramidase-domain-containing protein [Blastocladiella britannica]